MNNQDLEKKSRGRGRPPLDVELDRLSIDMDRTLLQQVRAVVQARQQQQSTGKRQPGATLRSVIEEIVTHGLSAVGAGSHAVNA